MSETKFTKGDWKFSSMAVGVIDKTDSQSYGMLEQICWMEDQFCKSEEEVEANARLIASAPEMYEALEDAADMLFQSSEKECRDFGRVIRVLLAKARGEH